MVSLVYMVAGLSSRFGGRIKQFAEVGPNEETFIEYSINQALKNPFSEIIFIVGKLTEKKFKEKFGDSYKGIPVRYALQIYDEKRRDRPWGTADAISSALNFIKDKCVVCNGDDLYGEKAYKIIFNHIINTNEDAVMSLKLIDMLPETGEVTRGVLEIEQNYLKNASEVFNLSRSNYKAKRLTEKTAVNINLFGLQKKTLINLAENVKKFKENNRDDRKLECFIHIELANLVKENKSKMKVYFSDERWLGITNPEDEIVVRDKLNGSNDLVK